MSKQEQNQNQSNKTESFAQLFTRLQSKKRPLIVNLSPEIIPEYGPKPKELIEISGESDCGKTIHLMELIARTIIPIEFGGKGASAIVIDTNSNFHVPFLLPKIIEKHIIHHRTSSCLSTDTEVLQAATNNVTDTVLEAMRKITFFKCYSGIEFELVLHNCANHLTTNTNISLIAVDSIATFYWSDCESRQQPIRKETYLRHQIKELRKLTDEFGLVGIYTRPADFGDITSSYDEQIDYKIKLKHIKAPNKSREARNFFENQQTARCFSINDFGIQWLSSTSRK